MGPFDLDRQLARAQACLRIANHPQAKPEVQLLWQGIHNRLALTESEYNDRVRLTYTRHNTEIVQ